LLIASPMPGSSRKPAVSFSAKISASGCGQSSMVSAAD